MARREARNFLVLGGKQIIFVLKNSRKSSQGTQETDTSIQQVSVSASEQANKANNLSVICSADKHFYSHLTSGITTFMSCVRVAQNYVATSQHRHKRRDARRISSFWLWASVVADVSQALSQPTTLFLM